MQTPLHIQRFNDKIKLLNQSNSKELLLTAIEARNLHVEIFSLLNEISQLQEKVISLGSQVSEPTKVELDGGDFF